MPRKQREQRGYELLRLMHLEDVAYVYPATLSGGMQQRVGFARAIAVEPSCLLLDEPFHALDPEIREALRGEVLRLVREHGLHVVIITHDLEEAAILADAVLVLRTPSDFDLVMIDHINAKNTPALTGPDYSHDIAALLRNVMAGMPDSGTPALMAYSIPKGLS